jgi:hypothetical protein
LPRVRRPPTHRGASRDVLSETLLVGLVGLEPVGDRAQRLGHDDEDEAGVAARPGDPPAEPRLRVHPVDTEDALPTDRDALCYLVFDQGRITCSQ